MKIAMFGFGNTDDDKNNLVHIVAPSSMHRDLQVGLEQAQKRGCFEGYEFIVTDQDVGVCDVDAMAEAIANRLDGVEMNTDSEK